MNRITIAGSCQTFLEYFHKRKYCSIPSEWYLRYVGIWAQSKPITVHSSVTAWPCPVWNAQNHHFICLEYSYFFTFLFILCIWILASFTWIPVHLWGSLLKSWIMFEEPLISTGHHPQHLCTSCTHQSVQHLKHTCIKVNPSSEAVSAVRSAGVLC